MSKNERNYTVRRVYCSHRPVVYGALAKLSNFRGGVALGTIQREIIELVYTGQLTFSDGRHFFHHIIPDDEKDN